MEAPREALSGDNLGSDCRNGEAYKDSRAGDVYSIDYLRGADDRRDAEFLKDVELRNGDRAGLPSLALDFRLRVTAFFADAGRLDFDLRDFLGLVIRPLGPLLLSIACSPLAPVRHWTNS